MKRHQKFTRSSLAVAALAVIAACSGGGDSDTTEPDDTTTVVEQAEGEHLYEATIRRTSDGVPHIVADDMKGLFFGQGYASGQDHACSLADQMLKITSTRAAALGAGDGDANINSDFAWKSIGINELARADYLDRIPRHHRSIRSLCCRVERSSRCRWRRWIERLVCWCRLGATGHRSGRVRIRSLDRVERIQLEARVVHRNRNATDRRRAIGVVLGSRVGAHPHGQ